MDRALLAGWPVVIEFPVAWGEMDAYQHVNNAVYFRYFESSRLAYIHALDWPEIERQTQVGPILASVQARFRKPLTYPDTVAVGSRVTTVSDDRFVMEHVVVSERLGAIAAEGSGVLVAYHYGELRKAPLPPELRERIGKLEGRQG
jgi:acyl-CoA thioester hydrolase